MPTDTHQIRYARQDEGLCPICIEQFADKEAAELSCGRTVCAECLAKYVGAFPLEVRCPMCLAAMCGSHVRGRELHIRPFKSWEDEEDLSGLTLREFAELDFKRDAGTISGEESERLEAAERRLEQTRAEYDISGAELVRRKRIEENQKLVSRKGLARIKLIQRAERYGLHAEPDCIFHTARIQRGEFDKARVLKFIGSVTGGPRSYWVWVAENDYVLDIAREWWKIKWNMDPDEGMNNPGYFAPTFTHMGKVLAWYSPLTMGSGEVIEEK